VHPIIFSWNGITIYSYGVMLACGFLCATLSCLEIARKFNYDKTILMDLGIWVMMCAVVGARLLYVALNWGYYGENLLEIILLNKGGLVFYGGFLGGILGAVAFLRKNKLRILKTGDLIVTVLPLGQMFGRIGCFLNGCCFGTPTNLPLKVIFPLDSMACRYYQELQPIHPVQLYESMAAGFIFLILITLLEHKRFHGQIIVIYGILYALARFGLEFLRGDNIKLWLQLTFSQWVSMGLIIGTFFFYWTLTPRIQPPEENT